MTRLKFICIVALAGISLAGNTVHAAFTFLEPTPYRSAADSPFDMSGLGTTFFLEDFEDFELNTPGADAYIGVGNFNSVDGDDGILDGSATGLSGNTQVVVETGFSSTAIFAIDFEISELGFYPTSIGFVITDQQNVNPSSSLLVILNALGERIASFDTSRILSQPNDASDDWFIGVTNPDGIHGFQFERTATTIVNRSNYISFDHLQYGIVVPEPHGLVVVSLALACYPGRGFYVA
jgi:hypothetical protein